jgi:hypothetical protein
MTTLTIPPRHVRPLVGSIVRRFYAAESMTVGNLAYVSDADAEEVSKTDANNAATIAGKIYQIVAGGRHLPSGAIAAGEAVTALEFGRVAWGPDVDLAVNQAYYVSDTAGGVEDEAGSNPRRIGQAETAQVFFFNPENAAPGY